MGAARRAKLRARPYGCFAGSCSWADAGDAATPSILAKLRRSFPGADSSGVCEDAGLPATCSTSLMRAEYLPWSGPAFANVEGATIRTHAAAAASGARVAVTS